MRDRNKMIAHISNNFNSWNDFYSKITPVSRANGALTYEGWYVCYEGFGASDMYLQTEHPCSDATGDLIAIQDCQFT